MVRKWSWRWRPLHDNMDLVIWTPREYNTVADHCCNVPLDAKRSWSKVQSELLAHALLSEQCLRLCVDGGRRSQKDGAIGMALYSVTFSYDGNAVYTLLARMGKLLASIDSAFVAEAAALEWALQYLVELFKGKVAASE